MSRRGVALVVIAFGFLLIVMLLDRPLLMRGQGASPTPNQDQSPVHGQDESQDQSDEQVSGPYEPVQDWPKPLSSLFPGEQGWTWGATQAIYAAKSEPHLHIDARGIAGHTGIRAARSHRERFGGSQCGRRGDKCGVAWGG